ncbi:uncharacterized protein LOC102672729 [Apis dorsata]|uniref:uncharacterized protein LOC102672729 n=1 Tax=Apis dorsata TaxID=7462 RepID=UPI0003DF5387|nr:uncharacterized protein LOC102672729 [Apis dorsata]
MFAIVFVVLNIIVYAIASEVPILHRIRRQDFSNENGQVIDKIFNIPITAIKQTATVAQSFNQENSQTIDNVFKIPISTLEAVGTLVKATSEQRRRNADDAQRIRQERRDRISAQRERQRFQREQLQQQRLKQQLVKKTKNNNKDPFDLNTLSLLFSNHGVLGSIQGTFGGYKGSHGDQEIHGGQGNAGGYQVHEDIEEDTNYSWHGITAGIGTFSGSRPTSTRVTIQNKIAVKDEIPSDHPYDTEQIQNKIAPKIKGDKLRHEEDLPLQNKIAPKTNRISFRS